MKSFYPILTAALMASGLALGGVAQAEQNAKRGDGASMQQGEAGMKGSHMMTGTVSKLDKAKGTLSLDTAIAPLNLHFPPPAIADLNEGDQVTVMLAIRKDGMGASGMKDKDSMMEKNGMKDKKQ